MKLNMLPDSRLLARPLTFTNFPNRLLLSLRMVLALPKLSKIGLAPSTWFSSSCGVTTCTVLEDCSIRRHTTSKGLTPVQHRPVPAYTPHGSRTQLTLPPGIGAAPCMPPSCRHRFRRSR